MGRGSLVVCARGAGAAGSSGGWTRVEVESGDIVVAVVVVVGVEFVSNSAGTGTRVKGITTGGVAAVGSSTP